MFVDASVLAAIINEEPDAEVFIARMQQGDGPFYISALARFEAVQAAARTSAERRGERVTGEIIAAATEVVDALIVQLQARTVAISEEIGSLAIAASREYGKVVGHPSRLNLGDCFAYACAKSLGMPLLYKGGDFARTDLG